MDKKRLEIALYLLAFGLGLLIGYNDLHNTDIQPSVLSIVIVTFGFGLFKPAYAWRWALLVGIGVPLIYLMNFVIPFQHLTFQVIWPTTFIALIPAFLGAYIGALIRRTVLENDTRR